MLTELRSQNQTEGYSCTLFQDYLVFYGGKHGDHIINHESIYNLKEKRVEKSQASYNHRHALSCPRYSHSACLYEDLNIIIFYGGRNGKESERLTLTDNPALMFTEVEGGVKWASEPGLSGHCMSTLVSNVYKKKLYLYHSNETNGNFGSLKIYDIQDVKWNILDQFNGDLKLSFPSDCAIFCDHNLYLFAENEDEKTHKRDGSEKIFEDVYVLDLAQTSESMSIEKVEDKPDELNLGDIGKVEDDNKKRWRRISPGGQVPGLLTNVSMVAANGIIFIFGLKFDELERVTKSVLWTYDTKREAWNEVDDIGTLTAGLNQRAVVYKNQLLIVDWNSLDQSVDIQYQNLDNLSFVIPSATKKQVCRDQLESFIQHCKNLYNERLFADITFEVEGEDIPAHKAILAYRSSYFMKMFTSGMSESHSTRIAIPNIKPHIFKALLQYIYCNEIELDEQLAMDLIPTVDEYLMKELKGICEKYLLEQLRIDNVADILIVADRHEIEDLKESCFRFIIKNIKNIDENEEMMKLSKTLIIEILKFNISTPPVSQTNNDTKPGDEEEKSKNSPYYRPTVPYYYPYTRNYIDYSPTYNPPRRVFHPVQTPTVPVYNPTAPRYTPTTPRYTPTTPLYDPTHPTE